MRIKKFTGKTMREAVEGLRREFGDDAVILHTAQKRRWFFGRIGPRYYEVLGAYDPNYQQRNVNVSVNTHSQTAPTLAVKEQANGEGRLEWSESIQELYSRLVEREIPKELAQDLIKDALSELPKAEWNNVNLIWGRLAQVMADRIVTVAPWDFADRQKIVILIGPTGVGKTTTVAKLAANFALVDQRSVAMITVDTYRIAAVEQLRTYAEIIGVSLEVAYSPKELRDGVAKHKDKDLILIDTAGRSQNNQVQMAELRNFLEGIEAEIHLVVSATTKLRDIDEIVRIFSQLSPDRIIVTKLDETTTHGVILQASMRAQVPLAFVTTGQGVPEDIEVASGERLAQLILGDKR